VNLLERSIVSIFGLIDEAQGVRGKSKLAAKKPEKKKIMAEMDRKKTEKGSKRRAC